MRPSDNFPSLSEFIGDAARLERPTGLPKSVLALRRGRGRPPTQDIWVPSTGSLTVGKYHITRGFFYAGAGLRDVFGTDIEPSLIDPALPLGTSDDYRLPMLGATLGYTTASPDARAAYLNWLANGRNDPAADIGNAFLYLIGLERRALVDPWRDEAPNVDFGGICDELESLIAVHAGKWDFIHVAARLIDCLVVSASEGLLYLRRPPRFSSCRGERFVHNVALSQAFRDGQPASLEWVLSWTMTWASPAAKWRFPGYFETLLALEFDSFPTETLLNYSPSILSTTLSLSYRPTYPGLPEFHWARPDIAVLDYCSQNNRARRVIWEMERRVADLLEPYRRHVRRKGNRPDSPEAYQTLPELLRPKQATVPSSLDTERLASLREETKRAGEVLRAIFEVDEADRSTAPIEAAARPAISGNNAIMGLDERHSQLVLQLLMRGAWTRGEVASMCSALNLMLDAALERINDAAFSSFDDSLLDGDEVITLNQELAEELQA
ncbi:TerB N-terminal domain-containing protein [Trinickia mobilis]|uniref:TerB N-terminal domain-containing protein n=1 Tax=Trinickia mobilis TaxID=2816356 RepID=UPI001A8F7078|nr:TerB N-terminal domain-containing protein [Trinickia mobilis]